MELGTVMLFHIGMCIVVSENLVNNVLLLKKIKIAPGHVL